MPAKASTLLAWAAAAGGQITAIENGLVVVQASVTLEVAIT